MSPAADAPEALPPFTMQPVTSSNIESMAYCSETGRMCVQFKGGNRYVYAGVPEDVFNQCHGSPSVGQAFHKMIKGQYEFTQE